MENTTESTASSSLIALKYGFISGLLSFLFSTLVNVMGWAENFQESIGWISGIWSLLLAVTITFLCLREFREQNEGFISYGQGLGLSTLLGAIGGLVAGGFNYIYIEFIDNSVIQRQMDIARENGRSGYDREPNSKCRRSYSSIYESWNAICYYCDYWRHF